MSVPLDIKKVIQDIKGTDPAVFAATHWIHCGEGRPLLEKLSKKMPSGEAFKALHAAFRAGASFTQHKP